MLTFWNVIDKRQREIELIVMNHLSNSLFLLHKIIIPLNKDGQINERKDKQIKYHIFVWVEEWWETGLMILRPYQNHLITFCSVLHDIRKKQQIYLTIYKFHQFLLMFYRRNDMMLNASIMVRMVSAFISLNKSLSFPLAVELSIYVLSAFNKSLFRIVP